MIPEIASLKRQHDIRNLWLLTRFETILPDLMERHNVDMWIIPTREYNEDPVVMSLLPQPAMSARRRTILVFCRNQSGRVDRYSLDRYGYENFYRAGWNPDRELQYEALSRLVKRRDPANIALNYSDEFAFADGLTLTEHRLLESALGETFMSRIISAEKLCVGWLETRIPEEIDAYPQIIRIAHNIIATAFSNAVIHPGITTTEDVIWWMRQKMQSLGLQAWFQPDIEIQATDQRYDHEPDRILIQPGDLLWCDMGFIYMGLATDHQQNAYVLRPNESDAPQGLKDALAIGNRLQDIHLEAMTVGRTGNEVLAATLQQATAENITAQVYSHPIGYHGHAAGPTIGLWDQQGGVSGRGDYPIYDRTAYSIELNIRQPIPEWENQIVRIALEEEAMMIDSQMFFLDGRQTNFHLIG